MKSAREKVIQFQVDAIHYGGKVFHTFYEVEIIHIDDQQLTLLVLTYPGFVVLIQVLEVVKPDGIFVISSALFNLLDEFRDISLQIDQQIRWPNEVDHGSKNIQIALVVAIRNI